MPTGSGSVNGLQTKDSRIACDLIVVCGHLVPDAGLLHQTGAKLKWDEAKGAWVPDAGVDADDAASGEGGSENYNLDAGASRMGEAGNFAPEATSGGLPSVARHLVPASTVASPGVLTLTTEASTNKAVFSPGAALPACSTRL